MNQLITVFSEVKNGKPRRKPLHKMPHDKINWYENKHRRQKRDSEFEKPRDGYIPSLW